MNQFSMAADSVTTEIPALQDEVFLGHIRLNTTNDNYIKNRLAKVFCDTLSQFPFSKNEIAVRGIIDNFFLRYKPSIPDTLIKQAGSTSLAGLLPLYVVSRLIDPDMIIESGVFVGSSLHMFSSTFDRLPIYAFDINLKKLRVKPDNASLNEMDWSQFNNLPRHDNTLAFFDDHINCAKRILECQSKGVRWAIFDDSPPVGRLFNYRYPAIPSIPMIMDESIPDGCAFEWCHQPTNTTIKYVHNSEICSSARNAIRRVTSLDLLMAIAGVSSGDKWLVEIA